MEQRQIAKQWRQWLIAACGLLMGASVFQGCKDDFVLTGQPEWLGNSIYERLEEDGNYTTMLKLIDDLGQQEVLSHTGSKTLFVANDSAFKQWFTKNPWGVNRYEQLSLSQKKLLLNNSMINNAYLIELMSNGRPQGDDNAPEEGRTMRRETATSIYDSVQILKPSQMPNTQVWAKFKDNGKSIPILKDATTAPMIHFLPVFMKINKMTSSDLDILTNHQANDINEAWVNGKKVVERDITCKNGYIQKVDGVFESSPNMAEIVRQHPNMSRWSQLLDRFSAPYYNAAGTREYNRLYDNQDSVYTLRYYSSQSSGGSNVSTPDGKAVNAMLRFDPGWNQYINNTTGNSLSYDAGAMFVPTNEALENWWNNEGKALKEEYGVIDSIPETTMAKLINVNMLPVFTEAIPSKFDRILNDAKEEMGVKMSDVDSCFMGCNGVVYMTNRVFTPAEFASVVNPALFHPSTMNVIYWAISAASLGGSAKLNFLPYLLSMQSRYSLILPSNNAMLQYLDFASYNTENVSSPTVLEFYYDEKKTMTQKVQARRYQCTIDEDGNITLGDIIQDNVTSDVIIDCLSRLMDQLIIVGDIEDGHEFYKSKGGTLLRVTKAPDGRLAFAGGWQTDHNNKILPVNKDDIYTKTNGKSYILNEQAPIATEKSVYMTLQEKPEFSEFLKLLEGSDLLKTKSGSRNAGLNKQGNMNLSLFDNYNYTVYVPTNESIRKLIDDGLLPTWDDYDAYNDSTYQGTEEEAKEAQALIKNIIVDFIRYHIQDHSIAINMAPEIYDEERYGEIVRKIPRYQNDYETMRRNPETSRFYPLTVNHEGGQMWVQDVLGKKHNVVKTEGLYNRICREYWYKGTGTAATTYQASDAVVHQIDGVLLAEEMTPWKSKLNKVRRK